LKERAVNVFPLVKSLVTKIFWIKKYHRSASELCVLEIFSLENHLEKVCLTLHIFELSFNQGKAML
jgi:hypothetical protein